MCFHPIEGCVCVCDRCWVFEQVSLLIKLAQLWKGRHATILNGIGERFISFSFTLTKESASLGSARK